MIKHERIRELVVPVVTAGYVVAPYAAARLFPKRLLVDRSPARGNQAAHWVRYAVRSTRREIETIVIPGAYRLSHVVEREGWYALYIS